MTIDIIGAGIGGLTTFNKRGLKQGFLSKLTCRGRNYFSQQCHASI